MHYSGVYRVSDSGKPAIGWVNICTTVSHGCSKYPYHLDISVKDIYLQDLVDLSEHPDSIRLVCQALNLQVDSYF